MTVQANRSPVRYAIFGMTLVLLCSILSLGHCSKDSDHIDRLVDRHHAICESLPGTRMLAFVLPEAMPPDDIVIRIGDTYLQPLMYGKMWVPSDHYRLDGLYEFHVIANNESIEGSITVLSSGVTTSFTVGKSVGHWWIVAIAQEEEGIVVQSQERSTRGYL